MFFPSFILNRKGIPALESTSVTAGSSSVVYAFNSYPWLTRYVGLVLFRLDEVPSGTATTLPVALRIGGAELSATDNTGAAVTAAGIGGEGLYMAWCNTVSGELKILTGLAAATTTT